MKLYWTVLFNSPISERCAGVHLNPLQKARLMISNNKGPRVIIFYLFAIQVMEGVREAMSKVVSL